MFSRRLIHYSVAFVKETISTYIYSIVFETHNIRENLCLQDTTIWQLLPLHLMQIVYNKIFFWCAGKARILLFYQFVGHPHAKFLLHTPKLTSLPSRPICDNELVLKPKSQVNTWILIVNPSLIPIVYFRYRVIIPH